MTDDAICINSIQMGILGFVLISPPEWGEGGILFRILYWTGALR